jgi:polyphosphate kinase
LRERLEEIIATELSDTELAWELHADGVWSRVPDDHGVNAQRELYQRALERAHRA